MKNKKQKDKKKNLNESVDAINSIADAFKQINEMLKKGIPFEIVADETDNNENANFNNDDKDQDLGFLQDEDDMDDLDFDEMNDVWDEMDEDDEKF